MKLMPAHMFISVSKQMQVIILSAQKATKSCQKQPLLHIELNLNTLVCQMKKKSKIHFHEVQNNRISFSCIHYYSIKS